MSVNVDIFSTTAAPTGRGKLESGVTFRSCMARYVIVSCFIFFLARDNTVRMHRYNVPSAGWEIPCVWAHEAIYICDIGGASVISLKNLCSIVSVLGAAQPLWDYPKI